MKKKFIGIFNPKQMTAEQIYEAAQNKINEKEHSNLLKLAKERAKRKSKNLN